MRKIALSGAAGWVITVIHLTHYLILIAAGLAALLLALLVASFDADHTVARARLDHIWSVWTAPHGEAERRLRLNGRNPDPQD